MAKKEKEPKTNNKTKRHFFKDMKAELKKVIWPTPKQTANNAVAVIAFTLAVALIVFLLDLVFDFGNKKVVDLQSTIKSSYSASHPQDEEKDEENTTEEGENTVKAEAETEKEDKNETKKESKKESKK